MFILYIIIYINSDGKFQCLKIAQTQTTKNASRFKKEKIQWTVLVQKCRKNKKLLIVETRNYHSWITFTFFLKRSNVPYNWDLRKFNGDWFKMYPSYGHFDVMFLFRSCGLDRFNLQFDVTLCIYIKRNVRIDFIPVVKCESETTKHILSDTETEQSNRSVSAIERWDTRHHQYHHHWCIRQNGWWWRTYKKLRMNIINLSLILLFDHLTSNRILQWFSKRIHSPFPNVNILLLSNTVLIFSMYTGSKSPSKQTYRCSYVYMREEEQKKNRRLQKKSTQNNVIKHILY